MWGKMLIALLALMWAICCTVFAAASLIKGAGATLPYPIYSKWFDDYSYQTGGIRFDYQLIGSGSGIKEIVAQTVDFGATDAPMSDEEIKKASGHILHIPTVLSAVVVAYNVNGLGSGLRLSGENVVEIFMGQITKWNDPKIAQNNPGLTLPNQEIVAIHRSDESGTTYVFTDYLAHISPTWTMKIGTGKSVKWPTGLSAKGNEGISGTIKQTPGSVGYLDFSYAKLNDLSYAFLQNRAGNFIEPSIEATTAALAKAKIPSDYRMSIVNQPGAGTYPIAGLTWMLLYQSQKDPAKGKALVNFLWWALHEGQSMTKDFGYAPLPTRLVDMLEKTLNQIQYKGKSLLESNVR